MTHHCCHIELLAGVLASHVHQLDDIHIAGFDSLCDPQVHRLCGDVAKYGQIGQVLCIFT